MQLQLTDEYFLQPVAMLAMHSTTEHLHTPVTDRQTSALSISCIQKSHAILRISSTEQCVSELKQK